MPRTLIILLYCTLLQSCSKPLEPSEKLQVAAVGVAAAAFAGDGLHVIIGSLHHGISAWRTSDGERLYDWSHRAGQDTALVAADVSADGHWALTADTHTLALWDMRTGAGLRFWQAPAEVKSAQLSGEGNTALLGLDNNTAVLFDVRRGGVIHTLHHSAPVNSVAISDDGSTALTGSSDYTAIAWDLRSGAVRHKIRHADEVRLVALSSDGTRALSMGLYDRALVWSTANGAVEGEMPLAAERLKRGTRLTAAQFSKDNQWLLTASTGSSTTLWQVAGLKAVAHWQIPRSNAWKPTSATIVDVAFSVQDDEFFAAASNGIVYSLHSSTSETKN